MVQNEIEQPVARTQQNEQKQKEPAQQERSLPAYSKIVQTDTSTLQLSSTQQALKAINTPRLSYGDENILFVRQRCLSIFSEANSTNLPATVDASNLQFESSVSQNLSQAHQENLNEILDMTGFDFTVRSTYDFIRKEDFMDAALKLLEVLNSFGVGIAPEEYKKFAEAYYRNYTEPDGYPADSLRKMVLGNVDKLFPMQTRLAVIDLSLEATTQQLESALASTQRVEPLAKKCEALQKKLEKLEIKILGSRAPISLEEMDPQYLPHEMRPSLLEKKQKLEASKEYMETNRQLQDARVEISVAMSSLCASASGAASCLTHLESISSFINLNSSDPLVKNYVFEKTPHERFFGLYKQAYNAYLIAASAGVKLDQQLKPIHSLLDPTVSVIRSYGSECSDFIQENKIMKFAAGGLWGLVQHRDVRNSLALERLYRFRTVDPLLSKAFSANNTYDAFAYCRSEDMFNKLIVAICAIPGRQDKSLAELKKYKIVEAMMQRASERVIGDDWVASSKGDTLSGLEQLCWIYGSKLLPLFPTYDLKPNLSANEIKGLKTTGLTDADFNFSVKFGNGLEFLVRNLGRNGEFFIKGGGGPWQQQSLYALFTSADKKQKEQLFSAMKAVDFEQTYSRFVKIGESDSILNEIFRQYQLWESKQR